MYLSDLDSGVTTNPRRASKSKPRRKTKGWMRTTTVTRVTKMTRKNPRVAKTKVVYVVQGNYGYGHGWEDENEEDNKVDAKRSIKEYRENGPGSYRLIRRRVKIEANPRKRRKHRRK